MNWSVSSLIFLSIDFVLVFGRLANDDHQQLPDSNVLMGNSDGERGHDDEARGPIMDFYDGAAVRCGCGQTFLDWFNVDKFKEERNHNIYYPFASRQEWEMGSWLLRSGLSMSAIDKFFSLDIVSRFPY